MTVTQTTRWVPWVIIGLIVLGALLHLFGPAELENDDHQQSARTTGKRSLAGDRFDTDCLPGRDFLLAISCLGLLLLDHFHSVCHSALHSV
jgi:hypothetical protein